MFERCEKTLFEIRATLLGSEKVRKLLYNDSPFALSLQAPTMEQVGQYIVTNPIFDMVETPEYDHNTVINIELDTLENNDTSVDGILRINVVCNAAVWTLDGSSIRPIQIADEVVRLLHNKKFSVADKLIFAQIIPLIINKKMIGYTLMFDISDGNGEIINY